MIEFEFLIRKTEGSHTHSDIELFYVMEGAVKFVLEEKIYILQRGDFLVVNVDKNHSYTADGDFLAACMHISYYELSIAMKQSMIFFWCNTSIETNEATEELHRVIRKIVAEQYNTNGQNVIYLNSLYYEMLNILKDDFLLNKTSAHYGEEVVKFDGRKHEIAEYIRQNFNKQISLDDLSKQLFLSYAYLSKYIKRQFGMGFAEYLNNVRLNFAVSQLLHSDQSVVRIAMDSGFATSAALNKAFREKYNMTPTEYRRARKTKIESPADSAEEGNYLRQQLQIHFAEAKASESRNRKLLEETVTMGNAPKKPLKKSWNKMINMGTVADLLQSDMQNHVLQLKEELHFEYVRFWDLYAPELYLDDSGSGYNFDKLDRVLDFLQNNGLKPYIELRNKPKHIVLNKDKDLFVSQNAAYHEDPVSMERFLRRFLIHLLNRYHTDELETWYFELWHAEPKEVLTQPEQAKAIMQVQPYLDWFELVAGVLREYVPLIRIGGGGFSMRYGSEAFRDMLTAWKQRQQLPDFISCYAYPYTIDTIDRERNQSRNVDLICSELSLARKIMEETNFPTEELHISEWNFSVSSRNILNDHCMKGAYLVHNMIESVEIADIMGYWVGSDLFSAHHLSHAIIDGSGGLLSKDGIRKPAFYAFEFMNHLGKYLRKRGENYIITDNGAGNWRIVCHNLKNLNHQYGLSSENEIRISEQSNFFVDMKKCCLHFDLPGKKGGKYLLRIQSLNQRQGSLQDEWTAMSAPQELRREDIRYLSQITTPQLVLQTCTAENGHILFDIVMEPNEIDYIHVTYQYS